MQHVNTRMDDRQKVKSLNIETDFTSKRYLSEFSTEKRKLKKIIFSMGKRRNTFDH